MIVTNAFTHGSLNLDTIEHFTPVVKKRIEPDRLILTLQLTYKKPGSRGYYGFEVCFLDIPASTDIEVVIAAAKMLIDDFTEWMLKCDTFANNSFKYHGDTLSVKDIEKMESTDSNWTIVYPDYSKFLINDTEMGDSVSDYH